MALSRSVGSYTHFFAHSTESDSLCESVTTLEAVGLELQSLQEFAWQELSLEPNAVHLQCPPPPPPRPAICGRRMKAASETLSRKTSVRNMKTSLIASTSAWRRTIIAI